MSEADIETEAATVAIAEVVVAVEATGMMTKISRIMGSAEVYPAQDVTAYADIADIETRYKNGLCFVCEVQPVFNKVGSHDD